MIKRAASVPQERTHSCDAADVDRFVGVESCGDRLELAQHEPDTFPVDRHPRAPRLLSRQRYRTQAVGQAPSLIRLTETCRMESEQDVRFG